MSLARQGRVSHQTNTSKGIQTLLFSVFLLTLEIQSHTEADGSFGDWRIATSSLYDRWSSGWVRKQYSSRSGNCTTILTVGRKKHKRDAARAAVGSRRGGNSHAEVARLNVARSRRTASDAQPCRSQYCLKQGAGYCIWVPPLHRPATSRHWRFRLQAVIFVVYIADEKPRTAKIIWRSPPH